MKLSLSDKILFGHIAVLIGAQLLVAVLVKNLCDIRGWAAFPGPLIAALDLLFLIIGGLVHLVFKNTRPFIGRIYGGFLVGFGIVLFLMVPTCLIIHKGQSFIFASVNPHDCAQK